MIIIILDIILIIVYLFLLEYVFYKDNNVATYTIFSILLTLNFSQSLYFDLDFKNYGNKKSYIYIINFFFIFLNGIFEYTHPFYILYYAFQHIVNMKTIINISSFSFEEDNNNGNENENENEMERRRNKKLKIIDENSTLIDLPVITYSSAVTK